MSHIINDKPTTHGHSVHYTDVGGTSHAAIITNINASGADLHVFHRFTGHTSYVQNVPHDPNRGPNTWDHLPA